MADRFIGIVEMQSADAFDLHEMVRREHGSKAVRPKAWTPDLCDMMHVSISDGAGYFGRLKMDCRLRAGRDGRVHVIAPEHLKAVVRHVDADCVLDVDAALTMPIKPTTPRRVVVHCVAERRMVLVTEDSSGARIDRDLTEAERLRYFPEQKSLESAIDILRANREALAADLGVPWGYAWTLQPCAEYLARVAKQADQSVLDQVAGEVLTKRYKVDGQSQLTAMRERDKRVDARGTVALPHQMGDLMAVVTHTGRTGSPDLTKRLSVVQVMTTSEVDRVGKDGTPRKVRRAELGVRLLADCTQQARIDKYGTRWATGLGVAVEEETIPFEADDPKSLQAAALALFAQYSMQTVRVLAAFGVAANDHPQRIVPASPSVIAPYLGLSSKHIQSTDRKRLSQHIGLAASVIVQVMEDGKPVGSIPALRREGVMYQRGKHIEMLTPHPSIWQTGKMNYVPQEWLQLDPVQQQVEMRLIWGACQRFSRSIGSAVVKGRPTSGQTTTLAKLLRGDAVLDGLRERRGAPAVRHRLEQAFQVAAGMGVVIRPVDGWETDPQMTLVTVAGSRLLLAEDARRGEMLAARGLAYQRATEANKQLPAGAQTGGSADGAVG